MNNVNEGKVGSTCSTKGVKRMRIVHWWESQKKDQYEGGWILLKQILDRMGR
jgi:hypothetical protein